MILGYGLTSILGQRLRPEDSGSAANASPGDPTFASYIGNPPDPVSFEITKANFDNVFTAFTALAPADLLFTQIDSDGDGTINQGDLLARGGQTNPVVPVAWTSTVAPADPTGQPLILELLANSVPQGSQSLAPMVGGPTGQAGQPPPPDGGNGLTGQPLILELLANSVPPGSQALTPLDLPPGSLFAVTK